MFVRKKTYNKALAEIEQLKSQISFFRQSRSIDSARALRPIEKKIKRFLSHKITHSRCLDRPDKMAREIYKWLVNNL